MAKTPVIVIPTTSPYSEGIIQYQSKTPQGNTTAPAQSNSGSWLTALLMDIVHYASLRLGSQLIMYVALLHHAMQLQVVQ